MKKYIISLDEGTTSARSIIFDRECNIVCMSQKEFPQIYPRSGWVEQDPIEIYASQYATLTECIAKSGISPSEIAGIGITNQRETTVVWDKATGVPVYNAIVWQCRRTADICKKLQDDGYTDIIREKTGLLIDAYFSATKIKWILDNVEGARERAERGELLFGTVDTWLLWKLTGGTVFATDRTNAARTMLYNIRTGDWDDELLELFSIPRSMLAEVKASGDIYGNMELFGESVTIGGVVGDQQSALFGQGCFGRGDAKITYGTGCFLLANTGSDIPRSENGLIATVGATVAGEKVEYALEGSVFVGGEVIRWLRDGMRFLSESKDSEYFARKVTDSGGVYFLPAFSGLGAPHWDSNARGMICGITAGTRREHIIRAALEAIAYQSNDVLRAMASDMGEPLRSIKVDGGASANGLLMQFQSDISSTALLRPVCKEATALGAALLCGLSTGFYTDRAEISEHIKEECIFTPSMSEEERAQKLDGWRRAIKACKAF